MEYVRFKVAALELCRRQAFIAVGDQVSCKGGYVTAPAYEGF